MTTVTTSLPSLPAVFRGIKSGHHWCFGDAEYADLHERFDDYRDFFAQLELHLHRDSRGFIYATSNDEDYKGSDLITRFVVFTAVWVDTLSDAGQDISTGIFRDKHHVSDLPHFNGERHRRLLAQVGVQTPDDTLRPEVGGLSPMTLHEPDRSRFDAVARPGIIALIEACCTCALLPLHSCESLWEPWTWRSVL